MPPVSDWLPRSVPAPAITAQTGGQCSLVSPLHFSSLRSAEAQCSSNPVVHGSELLLTKPKKTICLTEKGTKHACSGLKSSHE